MVAPDDQSETKERECLYHFRTPYSRVKVLALAISEELRLLFRLPLS